MNGDALKLARIPDAVVYSVEQFRDWVFSVKPGSLCMYHVGAMSNDREDDRRTDTLAKYASLMEEMCIVRLVSQRRAEGLYHYFASKTDTPANLAPRAVATCEIDAATYVALRAIYERQAGVGAKQALRLELGCNDDGVQSMFGRLLRGSLITDAQPTELTKAGLRALK